MPSKSAELVEVIEALKSVWPALEKSIEEELMMILNPDCFVRYRHERRLLLRSGTCKTRENSTSLASFPPKTGLNTTEPTPAE